MIDNWQSYRLEDFIPFTPEVYFRLNERINEDFWPLQISALGLGLAALILAWRGNTRLTLALLVPAWLSSGLIFHFNYYNELNVYAAILGYLFVVQAVLLTGFAAFGRVTLPKQLPGKPTVLIGALIAIAGLVIWPLIAPIQGSGWSESEIFALHPDPTVIASLGLIVLALTGWRAWLAALIPVLWCLITTLTLVAMEASWGLAPLGLALLAVAALLLRVFVR